MSASQPVLDAAGRRRSPATMPGFRTGIAPRNKGQRYPADPPTVDEIVAVMRQAGDDHHGHRLNALIVVLWRVGLRINEPLSLTETDLDRRHVSILVRHGKGDRRREVGMHAWAWSAIEPWAADRAELPVGPLFCVIHGPTQGCAWADSAASLRRAQSRSQTPARAPPVAPPHAVELMHEGIALPLMQRQLGHSHLSTTGTYLEGINTEQIISTAHARRAPMMRASAGLAL
jgi:site-specific recombinase XerD